MLESFFKNFILKYPKTVLAILMPIFVYLAFVSVHLNIDTSSKSLLIDNDPNLAFLHKINKDFYNPNILVITYTPNTP